MVEHPVRPLCPTDLPACMALVGEAGWNQTSADWRELFEAAPDGCFGIEIAGELAATTTAVCYGTDLAWIGMVLTALRFRRMGLAHALMRHALAYLENRRIGWIKLDATDMGRPLYLRLGFEDECAIQRWQRPGTPPVSFVPRECRRGESFARGRPGSKAAYFGPCQATSSEAARELLEWFLALHPGEAIYWDLFPENSDAVALAEGHGFAPVRNLVRMALRGQPDAAPLPNRIPQIYAIRGFAWG